MDEGVPDGSEMAAARRAGSRRSRSRALTTMCVDGETTVMRPSCRAAGNRRDGFYAAAASFFHSNGYDAASVQDIADAVGLLKSSVYDSMSPNEDLLFDLIQGSHDDLLGILEEILASDTEPLERLRELTRRCSIYVAKKSIVTGLFSTTAERSLANGGSTSSASAALGGRTGPHHRTGPARRNDQEEPRRKSLGARLPRAGQRHPPLVPGPRRVEHPSGG